MEQLEIINTTENGPDIVIGKPININEATKMFTELDMLKGQAFIAQGYILRVVQDERLYQAAGCLDIYQYAKRELNIKDDSTTNRYININRRFSKNGYSPFISDEYRNYSWTTLAEIWKMTDEEIREAGITETTTRAKIREIKKEKREAEAEPEIEEQIPGQIEMTEILSVNNDNIKEPSPAPAQAEKTSEKDKELQVLSEFAKEYYENYMDKKQHELLEAGKEDEAAQYTKEKLLPFFNEKKDILHYSINTGQIEISPDGYVRLKDNKVRTWREVYLRTDILKVLRDLTDTYTEGTFKKYMAEMSGIVSPEELITYKMAQDIIEELESLENKIPEEITAIQEMIKTEYEYTDIIFECGFNLYLAEVQGETISVSRTDIKTGQPETWNIFTIKTYDLVQEIHRIKNKSHDESCDGNCFYCNTDKSCNSKQEKRENCIYDKTRRCNMYAAHEEALNNGINCTSACCNRCDIEECRYKCSYARTDESTENVINATEKCSLKENADLRLHDTFENDSEPYGFTRNEMVNSLFEHLKEYNLEVEDVDGQMVKYAGIHRYVHISHDKMYVEFIEAIEAIEADKDIVDFRISLERLREEYIRYCKNNTENVINATENQKTDRAAGDEAAKITEDTEHEAAGEEIIEAEVITEQKPYYVPESQNAKENVIKNVMYNGITGQDKDGEAYTCPPGRKPCDEKCRWKPNGQTFEEKTNICTCCWEAYIRELIEKDRTTDINITQEETTVTVKLCTIREQKELPRLKNNELRKEWLDKFEEWPLWIDNKETLEKFYRYIFENGDSFVIRQAFSNMPGRNHQTGKIEKVPCWRYHKYYIVKSEDARTLSDSETNISTMVEYLKDMQKGGSK